MIERKWISKRTGETKIGTYDGKAYYNTWYAKNKDKVNEKIVCDVCNSKYSQANYSNHAKTKKHMTAFETKLNGSHIIKEEPIIKETPLTNIEKHIKLHIEAMMAYQAVLEKIAK